MVALVATVERAVRSDGTPSTRVLARTIDERLSQELVFAFVGPIGSGCSTAAKEFQSLLRADFRYDVPDIISVSSIIKEQMAVVGKPVPDKSDLETYIKVFQDYGNQLRKDNGNDYLAKLVVEKIHELRKKSGGWDAGKIQPKRISYVVDSIKNIEELNLLRKVYKETLIVVGVFSPDEVRNKRANIKASGPGVVEEMFSRDLGEKAAFGQATRKVFTLADCFLSNDGSLDTLRDKIKRFLNLCFDVGLHTPSTAEAAMYKANAVAGNSACLSRQVGAAIVSKSGEFIGVGWNDVPRFGGGLYDQDGLTENKVDNRCYKWAGVDKPEGPGFCHNERTRNDIAEKIAEMLEGADFIKSKTSRRQIREHLRGTPVDALIEFSRSIHAEMEAILSVAREGKHSLVGATLYTNTYPCHNCARHIVASGIAKVVYIEPYLKSHAVKLHGDTISEDPKNCENRVLFQQFDGISPRNYLKFFRTERERKLEGGGFIVGEPHTALPKLRIQLDGPAIYEDLIMASLVNSPEGGV